MGIRRWLSGTLRPDKVETDSLSTESVNSEKYASAFSGSTLDVKVKNALDALPAGRGRVRVTAKADGSAWEWTGLTLSTQDYAGIEIDVDKTAAINVTGLTSNGRAIYVDGAENGSIDVQIADGETFALTGGIWTIDSALDPSAWFTGDDLYRGHVAPNHVEGANNSNTDAIGVHVRNVSSFSERFHVGGRIYGPDIGVKYTGANLTGGTGTDSFHDNRVTATIDSIKNTGIWQSAGADWLDMKIEATLLLGADGARAWYLNGTGKDTTIFATDSEDPGVDNTGTVWVETGPNYGHGPLFLNVSQNNADTGVVRGSSTDFVPVIRSGGTNLLIENFDKNTILDMNRNGQIYGGIRVNREDLTARSPGAGEIAYHDGNGTPSRSLCYDEGGSWYNIRDDSIF